LIKYWIRNPFFSFHMKFALITRICIHFIILFAFESFLNPLFDYREALFSCFPGMHHLMCYFHLKQACQVKLRGKPMKGQKEILHVIDELHSSISPMEYNQLYAVMFRKWCNQCSEFVYYFENQWNSGTAFNQWKVHCCPPGVATTNNSLESFNAMFKRAYTYHTSHTMAALYDIIYDRLLVDLSRELLHARKVFHLKCKPDRESVIRAPRNVPFSTSGTSA